MKSTNYMGYSIISTNRDSLFQIALPAPWGLYGEFKTLAEAQAEIRSWDMSKAEHEAMRAKRTAEVEGEDSNVYSLEMQRTFKQLVKRAIAGSEVA